MKKYITVAIPNYNHAHRLEVVINSVINQTLSNDKYEILVIDDGSTDNSINILNKFEKKIQLITRENRGLSLTRRDLIKNVSKKTTHIYFLDADDIMTKGILENHYNNNLDNDKYISADLQYWENGKKKSNAYDVYKKPKRSIIYTTATSKLWPIKDARKVIWPAGLKNEDDCAYPIMLGNKKLSFIPKEHRVLVLNEEGSLSKQVDSDNAKKIVDYAFKKWDLTERNLALLIHSICSEGAWKYLKSKAKKESIKLPGFIKAGKHIGYKRSFADFWVKKLFKEKHEKMN